MADSFIKRILGFIFRNKHIEDDRPVAPEEAVVPEEEKASAPAPAPAPVPASPPARDIYSSIMASEAKTASEEDIGSTVTAILSVIENSEEDIEETDPEWKERRAKIMATCREILAERGQQERKENIRELLRLTSGLTSTALFCIRLKEMTRP